MKKRWKLSDVFDAIAKDCTGSRSEAAARIATWARQDCATGALRDRNVGSWLGMYASASHAMDCDAYAWCGLTDEQRCAAVVREARRLNVPRNA